MPAFEIRERLTCTKCLSLKEIGEFYVDRRASSGRRSACKECDNTQKKEYHSRSEVKAKRAYYEKNVRDLDKKRAVIQEWAESEAGQQWRAAYKETQLENKRRYNASAKGRLSNREYRARRRAAMPSWADVAAIKEFYRNCPEGHHVDHIIPLNGKNICGLHVLENLQYLTEEENLRKSNKWENY